MIKKQSSSRKALRLQNSFQDLPLKEKQEEVEEHALGRPGQEKCEIGVHVETWWYCGMVQSGMV